MILYLPPHISFGFVGARVIALDIAADRYFLLSGEEAAAVSALAKGEVAAGGAVRRLEQRGFLSNLPGLAIAPVLAPALAASALETGSGDVPIGLVEAVRARIAATASLRFAGLAPTIHRWRRLRERTDERRHKDREKAMLGPDGSSARLARGFAHARLFVPARRACVPDSLALAACLWRRGASADIFFGVRLDPFAAHCWVQAGPILLSDPFDIVREFCPVFRL